MSEQASFIGALQLFLIHLRNLAGPWKAGILAAIVYIKFERYLAVLGFFEILYRNLVKQYKPQQCRN